LIQKHCETHQSDGPCINLNDGYTAGNMGFERPIRSLDLLSVIGTGQNAGVQGEAFGAGEKGLSGSGSSVPGRICSVAAFCPTRGPSAIRSGRGTALSHHGPQRYQFRFSLARACPSDKSGRPAHFT
jgi:hypothetical protein